ncbi:hypothetical protein L3V83_04435 [Thiotrichales bacterium 19X7-9]|nr:hypothetical protein [Thiotrichales bacterium 19X7-9]
MKRIVCIAALSVVFILGNLIYAEAGVNLKVKNNCPIRISFFQSESHNRFGDPGGDMGFTKPGYIMPGDEWDGRYLSHHDDSYGKEINYYHIGYRFSGSGRSATIGGVTLWLYSSGIYNYLELLDLYGNNTNLLSITHQGCHADGVNACWWRNMVNNTPTYTMTACPNSDKIELKTYTFGLGNMLVSDRYNNKISLLKNNHHDTQSMDLSLSKQSFYQFRFTGISTVCYLNPQSTGSYIYCNDSGVYPYVDFSTQTLAFFCNRVTGAHAKCPHVTKIFSKLASTAADIDIFK